jgi:hypothetical protein
MLVLLSCDARHVLRTVHFYFPLSSLLFMNYKIPISPYLPWFFWELFRFFLYDPTIRPISPWIASTPHVFQIFDFAVLRWFPYTDFHILIQYHCWSPPPHQPLNHFRLFWKFYFSHRLPLCIHNLGNLLNFAKNIRLFPGFTVIYPSLTVLHINPTITTPTSRV